MTLPNIVMIDSSPEAIEMVRFALWKNHLRCSFQAYPDAVSARRCLLEQRRRSSDGPLPSLILLESDLDYTDGLDVLRALRADLRMVRVPVVVFPSSDLEGEPQALAAGASAYVPKPVDAELYTSCIVAFYDRWCRTPGGQPGHGGWSRTPARQQARRRGEWMGSALQWAQPAGLS